MADKKTAKNVIGKGKAGPGRPKGVANKSTTALKDMILKALDNAGGVDYLATQARETPTAFMALVGKVLPLVANVDVNGQITHEIGWVIRGRP